MFWLSCWCGKELNRPIRAKPLNLLYSLIALQNKVHTQTNQYRFVHHICVHTIWLKKAGLKFKCKTLKLVQSKCLQHNCLYKMFSFNIMIFGLSEVCAFSWINFTFGFGLWVWVKWLPFSKRLYKVEGFHDVTFLYLSLSLQALFEACDWSTQLSLVILLGLSLFRIRVLSDHPQVCPE